MIDIEYLELLKLQAHQDNNFKRERELEIIIEREKKNNERQEHKCCNFTK